MRSTQRMEGVIVLSRAITALTRSKSMAANPQFPLPGLTRTSLLASSSESGAKSSQLTPFSSYLAKMYCTGELELRHAAAISRTLLPFAWRNKTSR